jgi:DNA replication protein DnaC
VGSCPTRPTACDLRFPPGSSGSLAEFDVAVSSVPVATFDYLSSLGWVRAAENVCLIGPAATGKSHLLVGLGVAAVAAGHRTRYFTAAELVETLYRGLADNSVGRLIDTLLPNDLIICDELGSAPLDDNGAQLLFRFVAAGYDAAPSASAHTGRSSPGAGSCPNTAPPCPRSTGCCTTATS